MSEPALDLRAGDNAIAIVCKETTGISAHHLELLNPFSSGRFRSSYGSQL